QRVPASLDSLAEIDRFTGRSRSVVEILPRAKAAAGTREDHDPHIAKVRERVAKLAVHCRREAVEAIGAVERDPGDWPSRLEVDGLVSHAVGLAKEGAWTQTNLRTGSLIKCSPARAPGPRGASRSRKPARIMRVSRWSCAPTCLTATASPMGA